MTVRIEELKEGMKVKLVDTIPWGMIAHPIMGVYLGSVCTIKTINITNDYFEIQEDQHEFYDGGFKWSNRFIEKIVEEKEKQNKVYRSLQEIKEDSIEEDYYRFKEIYWEDVNRSYELEKCIVNNNCVIGIFRYGTRIYKGIAKCQPSDKFSLAKGLTIAMLRAYKDYLDKEIKSLY